MTDCPRLIVAGTHSGAGKTSVTLALLSALAKAGRRPQAFKVGPDYIDPSYHTAITRRSSRNLDAWMMGHEAAKTSFSKAMRGAEVGVIEGVMGLFDGLGTTETSSTAEMAKLLGAPVLLVIDGHGLSRSAAAMALGYQRFDPEARVVGVILSKVSGERHARLLADAIESQAKLSVLGFLPNDPAIQVPERHLGLTTAQEHGPLKELQDRLGTLAARHFQLDKIIELARQAPRPAWQLPHSSGEKTRVCRIGIARDEAFSFYYQDNLDLLEELGAELVAFSPLRDQTLPVVSGLYFGGGFPELHAAELEDNAALRGILQDRIAAGLPVYAECGGLMYLSEAIDQSSGPKRNMVGAIPGAAVMTERLQNFGYGEATALRKTLLAEPGETIRGHEFHYSRWSHEPPAETAAYEIKKARTGEARREGFASKNVLASYQHLHFLGCSSWARRFVDAAAAYARMAALIPLLLSLTARYLQASSLEKTQSDIQRELALKIISAAQSRLDRPLPQDAFKAQTVEESLSYLAPGSRLVEAIPAPIDYLRGLHYEKTVESKRQGNGLGYLRILRFSERTAHETLSIFKAWKQEGLKGLLLDLRGNPGGRLDSATRLIRDFTPTCPLVILIDGQTASSAELVALSLKDSCHAILVGMPSKGKHSVQELIPIDPHHTLLLTIGEYPFGGRPLPKQLQPAYLVDGPQRQLEMAWNLLKEKSK